METTKSKIVIKLQGVKLPMRRLPKTLIQAVGLLVGKLKKTPLQYQKTLRKEWS